MNPENSLEKTNQHSKQSSKIYQRFLRVVNGPLEKNQKNSIKDAVKGILKELKFHALDAIIPFIFISFLFLILLLLLFPNDSWTDIVFVTFVISYLFLLVIFTARPVIAGISNTFNPWNEFVFHEILSREESDDKTIEVISNRLIENFSLYELFIIKEQTNKYFDIYNDKWKDVVELSAKCAVVFTVFAAIPKDFVNNTFLNSRSILMYGFICGTISMVTLLYRLIREAKFKKLLDSIDQAIAGLEDVKNKVNSTNQFDEGD